MDARRYQASRSLYRALAPLLGQGRPAADSATRQRLLDACEYAVARIAENPRAPTAAARSLFGAVRSLFPLVDQARVREAVARAATMAAIAEERRRAEGRRCVATRRDGRRCQRERRSGSRFCPSHARRVA
jgi:hypothetical protein